MKTSSKDNNMIKSFVLSLSILLFMIGGLSFSYDASAYPLDEFSRMTPKKGKVVCPKLPLKSYQGEHLRYHKRLLIHPAFIELLKPLEKLANEVAIEVYGRAPKRLFHLGSYNCRRIGGYPEYISEHGFGNALDIAGFDFGPLPKGTEAPKDLPKRLKRSFKVRMLKDWDAKGKEGAAALHERFLQTFARRMIERQLFRVILGPVYPGHKNHLHVDQGPYDVIEVF